MKIKNLTDKYRENRFLVNTMILAVILLGILGISVAAYKIYTVRTELVPDVQISELQKKSTLETIQDPDNLVRYVLKAIEEGNLDMALRACPIDELGLGLDTEKVIEDTGEYSDTKFPAYSGRYRAFFSLASAELTGTYTESILAFMESYGKYENIEVENIGYIYPERQMQSENVLRYQTICNTINADAVCEMGVAFESQGEHYVAGFTLASYYGGWKLLSFTSDLAETTENTYINEIDTKEIQTLFSTGKSKELEKELFDDSSEDEEEDVQDSEKTAQMIEEGEALLPANYFVINSAYGSSPQDLMEEITKYMEKGNTQAQMNFYVTDPVTEGEELSSAKLQQQKTAAENIQSFYFQLLREGKKLDGSLEELGLTAGEIVDKQNPDNMFYLDLMKVMYDQSSRLCRAFFWYGGDIYEGKIKLHKSENGWQIESFESVKQITQKEYDSLE